MQYSFCLLANIEWNFSSLTERYLFFFRVRKFTLNYYYFPLIRMPAKWEDGDGIQSLQATSVHESSASWSAKNKWSLSQSANLNHSWMAHHSATGAPPEPQVLWSSQVFFTLRAGWVKVLFYFPLVIVPLSFYYVFSLFAGTANSCCTRMYEKTFPIKVVQSPTHSTSSGRAHSVRQRCTAQEVGCEDTATMTAIIHVCLFLLTLFCFFLSPVGPRGGEGRLPAAPHHGFRWSVVFCSQRQLSRHREVTQRFVSVYINLVVVVQFYSTFSWNG